MKILVLLASLFLVFATANAAPGAKNLEPSWKGGKLNVRVGSWPKSLNYPTNNGQVINLIWRHVGLKLLFTDYATLDPVPWLAKKWKVGKDKKTFTFYLNKNATWGDGKPVTAEDVKFTLGLYYDKKRCLLCEPIRSFNGPIEYVKAIDMHTVEIKSKEIHFDRLRRLGSIYILPKHKYSKGNFDKDFNKVIHGGGPYIYDKKASKFRKNFVVKRRKNYWGNEYKHFAERFNFDKVVFKVIKDETVAFESFKRKELDVFYFETVNYNLLDNQKSAPFTDKNFKMIEAEKFNPSVWRGVVLNMRTGILADKKVRKAMQHLLNRDLITSKIYKKRSVAIGGPFMRGYIYSSNKPSGSFDLKKAGKLLKSAGFTKSSGDGYLAREVTVNGKKTLEKASVTVLFAHEKHEQWLTVYKEDAKKAGVEIVPKYVEWSKLVKLADEFKYQAFVIGWGGSPVPGPRQLFYGKTINDKGTSNYAGLNNARLDKLIDVAPAEFNVPKRLSMYHEMERIIIDEQPYVFQWTDSKHIAAAWKDRVDTTDKPFWKYSGNLRIDPFYFHWRAVKK